MQEPRYEEVGGGSSGHPELEEIAAYLEGGLSRDERAGIMRHLSVCEECLELLAETARELGKTGADTAEADVVPFVRRVQPSLRWLPYAAAAAVLLALALPGYLLFRAPRQMEVAEVLDPLTAPEELARVRAELVRSRADPERPRVIWEGPTYRTGELPETEAPSVVDFLVGAHLAGFQQALEAGDSAAAGAAARRAAIQIGQGYSLEAEAQHFIDAANDLEIEGASTSRYASLVEETSEAIEESFAGPSYEFGKWAQAGHIAARIGSRAWFERRANRRFLSWILRQDEEIDSEALTALRQIEAIWERGEMRRGDFDNLAAQFHAILQRYEALSRQDTLSDEEEALGLEPGD